MKLVQQTILRAAVVGAVVLVIVLTAWKPVSIWWQWYHYTKPDIETRMAVSGLKAMQIDAIEVVSWRTPHPWQDIVKDRPAITLLLAGLQDARIPDPMIENRVETVVIRLKNGRTVGRFAFGADRRIDAFSPTFIEGLKAIKMKLPRWSRE